jgi:L-ribulose-5-phosphate 3-epimerase
MSAWPKAITLRAFPAGMPVAERLALARACGYDGVEVNLERTEELTSEASEHELRALRTLVESHGLVVSSVYSREQWLSPITSRDPDVRDRGVALLLRLIRAAEILETDAVLVVPGAVDNGLFAAEPEIVRYDVAYESAQAALGRVEGAARDAGVSLAVENVWNKFLLSPLELRRFIDEIGSPAVRVYFDVGNVFPSGFPEQWIEILGSRICRVHFKDFRIRRPGEGDFVGLLEGDVDWPAVRAALCAVSYRSWITAEVLPAYKHHPERLVHEAAASMDAILRA